MIPAQVGVDWGEDQYAIAAQHYRQQRWSQAVGQFELLLDREPNHARAGLAHFFLAESHVQLDQYEFSLPHFQAFLEREPNHSLATRAQFRLGEAFYLLGRDDESIQALKALLPQDPERQYTEFIWAYLGEMLLRQEEPASTVEARDYLQQLLREYPDSSLVERTTLALAQAYQRLNDPQGAEAMLRRLREGTDESVAEEALLALASLWIERGEPDLVVTALDDVRLQAFSPRLRPRAGYWRGRGEMALQNWAAAATLLRDSLAALSEPRLSQAATYDAAICYWQAGDLTQAEQLLIQGLENWPSGSWAAESQFLLLQAAIREQRPAEMAGRARTFLDRFPDHDLASQVREVLGRLALNAGDYAAAESQFRALIQAPTGNPDSGSDEQRVVVGGRVSDETKATWHYLWGLSLMGLERFEPSLLAWETCLALLPEPAAPAVPTPSLEEWLRQRFATAAAESVAESRLDSESGRQGRLREQARFARSSALTRLQRWPEALSAQAELLVTRPQSSYRFELWADRLRILAATEAWVDYPAAAEVARHWLNPEADDTPPATPLAQAAQSTLAKALTATALMAADHWYSLADYSRASQWYGVAATAEDSAVVEQALSGLAWSEFQTLPVAEAERTARLLLDRFVDSPRSAEVGLKLAQQQYRDGRLIPAAELLQTLLARFPTWPRRHQLSALLGKILGQQAGATAKQQAMAAMETAIRDLAAVVPSPADGGELARSRDLWMSTYLYDLAWLQQEAGQADQAQEQFAKIHQGYPGSRYWADATFRLAQSHFGQGRLAITADLLEQIIQAHGFDDLAPPGEEAESQGVPALMVSQRRPTSEATTAAITAPFPVSSEIVCQALYLRAMVAASDKDWPAVILASERLVKEFPEHRLRWLAQYWWGEACFRLQRFPQSIELLTDVLPRTDAQTDSWVAMTHLRLAQSYGHLDRWREVLHVAEVARSRFPEFAQLYELDYLIGRALATEARFPQARAAYQQVIDSPTGKFTETAAMAQWMIGETYFHQEQYGLAAEAYHRTETLYSFPQWQAAALFQAGQCYENLRRDSDAENVYRQLLREHGQCSLAERAKERLEQLNERRQTLGSRPPNAVGGPR